MLNYRGSKITNFVLACNALLAIAALANARGENVAREPLTLRARMREPEASRAPAGEKAFVVEEKLVEWKPTETAIIICDMWNEHWCKGATRRVGELAPVMNRTVAAARAKGVFIIHAPSSCMNTYKDHPARKRAQFAPKAATTDPNARKARHGILKSRRSRSKTKTRSATQARRSGTCSRAGELKMRCSWACTRTCACSADRSACGT